MKRHALEGLLLAVPVALVFGLISGHVWAVGVGIPCFWVGFILARTGRI